MTDDTRTPRTGPEGTGPHASTETSMGGASAWSAVPPAQPPSGFTPQEPVTPAQSLEPLPPPPPSSPAGAPGQHAAGGYQPVYGGQPQPGPAYAGAPGGGYTPPPPPPGYAGGPGPQYPPGAPPPATGQGLSSNAVAALSYLTFIPAVVFLVMEPYNRDRFVRFHAWQSIALWVVIGALHLVFAVLAFTGFHILWWFIHSAILLILFVFWLIALIKASQGQWYKIPAVGDLAQSFAGSQP